MTQTELDIILENHALWLKNDPEGERADLSEANLDFSSWPLWCGGLHVTIDAQIARQLAYHFCAQNCDDPEYISARNAVIGYANKFHRAAECGILEIINEEKP